MSDLISREATMNAFCTRCKLAGREICPDKCEDLKLLEDEYEVLYVKPFNMFSRTYHIENFVWLKKKS